VIYTTLVYKRAGAEILLSDLPKRILTRGAELGREPRQTVRRSHARSRKHDEPAVEVAALERMAIEEALARTRATRPRRPACSARSAAAWRAIRGTVRAMMRRMKA